jgi:hypothetical protein
MYLETEDNPMPDGWAECKKNSIFCKLCKKWGKNNDCAVKGLTRFRDDTFAKHVQSRDHQEAIKLHEGKVSDHRLQVHCSRSDPVTCLRGIAISNAARLLCISFMLDLSRKLLRSEMLLVCWASLWWFKYILVQKLSRLMHTSFSFWSVALLAFVQEEAKLAFV